MTRNAGGGATQKHLYLSPQLFGDHADLKQRISSLLCRKVPKLRLFLLKEAQLCLFFAIGFSIRMKTESLYHVVLESLVEELSPPEFVNYLQVTLVMF